MNSMTLGAKITLGFAMVLIIAAVLGGIGVYNMTTATSNAEKMDQAYVPEVEIATGLERNFLKTRMNMVGYIYSESDKRLADARQAYERAMERLQQAKDLVKKFPWLVVLHEKVTEAEKNLAAYKSGVDALQKVYKEKDDVRAVLDKSAAVYMKMTADFLEGQNSRMEQEIDAGDTPAKLQERLKKNIYSNDLINIGSALRIANFSAAARRDTAKLMDGIAEFEAKFEPTLKKLEAITRLQVDIDRINQTREAGNAYKEALKELLVINEKVAVINDELVKTGEAALKSAEETSRAGVGGTKKLAQESMDGLSAASNIMTLV